MKDYYISTIHGKEQQLYQVVEVETKITRAMKTFDTEQEAEEYLCSLTEQ